jgi:hypothetical protein
MQALRALFGDTNPPDKSDEDGCDRDASANTKLTRQKLPRPITLEEKRARQKLAYQKWAASAKGKATQKRRNERAKANGSVSKFWKSDKGKALAHKEYLKKKASPGKLLMLRIGTRMQQAFSRPEDSTRLKKWTEFKGHADCRSHFEGLFEDWMSWDNYGPYTTEGPRHWNIGHIIPLSKYDSSSQADMKRCWSKANLKPQCAKENQMALATLPSIAVMNGLKEYWPASWAGKLPV